jgi:hypothetical protein
MTEPYPYETATEEQKRIGSWWWCVHHEIHLEPLTEPAENRVQYILEHKPENERETRLREFRPVLHPERIPAPVLKAWAKYVKAWAKYVKAWAEHDKARAEYVNARAEYDKAWAKYVKAPAEHEPVLMALHREEYPDTKWNGKSIFGEAK